MTLLSRQISVENIPVRAVGVSAVHQAIVNGGKQVRQTHFKVAVQSKVESNVSGGTSVMNCISAVLAAMLLHNGAFNEVRPRFLFLHAEGGLLVRLDVVSQRLSGWG